MLSVTVKSIMIIVVMINVVAPFFATFKCEEKNDPSRKKGVDNF
jgi:hypothetical protein